MINIKKISINFNDCSNKVVPFQISNNEKEIDIHIYLNLEEDFQIYVINPNNKRFKFVSYDRLTMVYEIDNVKIKRETYIFDNINNYRKIRITLSTKDREEKVWEGKWKLLFIPNKQLRGNINIYIEYSRYSNILANHLKKVRKINERLPIYFDTRVGYEVLYKPGFEEELRSIAPTYEFRKISNNIGILFANTNFQDISSVENLKDVLGMTTIKQIRQLVPLSSLSSISHKITDGVNQNEEIGVNFLKNNPNISLNGRGVLIGIIDTGIDYLHPDFIYEDNTSKVVSIWDQDKDGRPPEGFYIGSEYNREEINQAIMNNDGSLSQDDVGSGTMLAGICAGMGNANANYKGVAEGAELIVVKMTTIDGYYDNSLLISAYDYILKKAEELQRPVVINVGLGSNNRLGSSNGDSYNTTFLTRGVCFVNGIGNEGNSKTHVSGRLLYEDDIKGIVLEVDEEEENIKVEIWINKPDVVRVAVVSPSGELTRDIDGSNFGISSGILDLESTTYSIRHEFPTPYSGQQRITINLINVKKGRWTIRLTGESITSGFYNAYLQNRSFLKPGTRFIHSNSDRSVSFTATYEDNITVGAYDTNTDSLWKYSSKGNTLSDIQKPDIVAPGVNIIAPFPGGGYATITGTAPAAAYTSGCVALLLQYTIVDQYYPRLGIIQKIRTYLRVGATRFDNTSYPNSSLGYGLLNITGAFNEMK